MAFQIGFSTQDVETSPVALSIQGKLPSWLQGNLLRTGPARFNVGPDKFRHWFDGLAMLYRFNFGGELLFSSKFLRTTALEEALKTQRISSREFGTNPRESFIQRIAEVFHTNLTDNGNVNVSRYAERFVALTETPSVTCFNPETLETLARFQFDDALHGQLTTAHPHVRDGAVFNLIIEMGKDSFYQLYRMPKCSNKRELVARLPVKSPSYMHSFGITERYAILVESPLRVNPLELMVSGKPYIENYHWDKKEALRLLVVSLSDGQLVRSFETPAGFMFHIANAFERDGNVFVDMALYEDNSIVNALYLDRLNDVSARIPTARLTRVSLDLSTGSSSQEPLCATHVELPRINYERCNGLSYRHVFAAGVRTPGNFFDQLISVDTESGAVLSWHQDGTFPGEPVFVGTPGSSEENDGVLISLVLDSAREESFLLVLNAQTFEESARAYLPSRIPFHFHGQFYRGKLHV